MRILFYNWIQFDKSNNSGGGVNVYQKNVIDYLINNTDNEVFFLSSGIYYNVFSKKIRIMESKNTYGDKCRTYRLYNSPSMAPVKAIYEDLSTYLDDTDTYDVFLEFVKKNNIEVIHFNNIEGLPLKCLKIKEDCPDINVIYSLHNYFMFCPQVNLYYKDTHTCEGCTDGVSCSKCLAGNVGGRQFRIYYKIDTILEKLHMEKQSDKIKLFFKNLYSKLKSNKGGTAAESIGNPADFRRFKEENVKALNKCVDSVIAVSDRVKDIAVRNGVSEDKVRTLYIGTKVAEQARSSYHGRADEKTINIAFMGYFEKFKGLEFLISALEALPEDLKKKIVFKCYARRKTDSDDILIERVNKLNNILAKTEYHNGYIHSQLPEIMSGIDLGIVPVLWEDNLPQVAIEFASYGVPVLASDLGGAHELSRDESFIFKAGDKEDFAKKLSAIVSDPKLLERYFDNRIKLNTVKEHMETLLCIFSGREG